MNTPRSSARILLVDDDRDLLRLMSLRLSAAGYTTSTATSGDEALAVLDVDRPAVVVTDLRMDGMDGFALFETIHRRDPALPVIILTAHGSIPDAVRATRNGVFAFLTKPFDGRELVGHIVQALALTGGEHTAVADRDDAWRHGIITRSPTMEAVLTQTRLVAASEASVLIRGASGTGKELLARALHRASPRRSAEFVAVNCAAIPETLLESELFGYVKGAFTGAAGDRPGLFQAAHGGTLFLDEIGDMPLALQPKMLRAVQERQVRPVGSTSAVPADVRLVSATHRNLEDDVHSGRFREDLYFRLNVVTLELPDLDQRREDIPLLATHFLRELGERGSKPVTGLAPEAMELLVSAPWPGNVRQLFNVVEHAYALSTTPLIPAGLVRTALRERAAQFQPLEQAVRRFEQEYLVRLLKITSGNVTQAARMAGRNRTDFYKLLRRHQIDPGAFKSGG